MAKFHINGKGEAGACKAVKGGCPFGDETEHFTTPEAARKHFEESMTAEADETYNVSWSNEDHTFDSGSLSLKDARAKRQGLKAEGITATLTPESAKTKALVEEVRWAVVYAEDSGAADVNSEIAKGLAKDFPQMDQATLKNRVTTLKKEWADRPGQPDMLRSVYVATRLVEDMKVSKPNEVAKGASKYEAPREDGTRAFVLTISGALGGGTQERTVYAKTSSEARQRTARSLPHLAKIKSVVRKPAAGTVSPEPVNSSEKAFAERILKDQDYERVPHAKTVARLSTGQWQTLADEQDAKKKAAVTAYLEAQRKTGYSMNEEGTLDFSALEVAKDLGSMREHVEKRKADAEKSTSPYVRNSYEGYKQIFERLEKIVKPGEEQAYIDKRRAEHNAVTELEEAANREQQKLNLLNSITEKSKR